MKSSNAADRLYRRQIRAWAMYDWANSAFATTIIAALLPVYFSQVAGATLPSPATATAIWSYGLSASLLITAFLSPILGTMSDIGRAKKRFLAFFVAAGSITTALLVLVDRGDWLLASILFIIGRIAFASANVFYDSLLPHISRPQDRDSVSAKGYALGYLGGGLLLAVNIAMVYNLPGTWGARLSFLSVGLWWALFSIPLFLRIPEPSAAEQTTHNLFHLTALGLQRLWVTFKDLRRYRELLKFLIAFLIYNDGIGTIIGMAAIYGAELGFEGGQLVLAILLVQFVGIPFSLAFGSLPNPSARGRDWTATFVLISILALPLAGLTGARLLPADWTGAAAAAAPPEAGVAGQGTHAISSGFTVPLGTWEPMQPSHLQLQRKGIEGWVQRRFGTPLEATEYLVSLESDAALRFSIQGDNLELVYATGPQFGDILIERNERPLHTRGGVPIRISTWSEEPRFGLTHKIKLPQRARQDITLKAVPGKEGGHGFAVAAFRVLPDARRSNIFAVGATLFSTLLVSAAAARLLQRRVMLRLAPLLSTKGCILLALFAYSLVAIWGFMLDSVLEFWLLAWMIAMVQGGSQALSRSLYASLAPPEKSGEFFGLFSVMAKFSSFLGPLVFATAVAWFGSSRPAILSILLFFVIGGALLQRVKTDAPAHPTSENP